MISLLTRKYYFAMLSAHNPVVARLRSLFYGLGDCGGHILNLLGRCDKGRCKLQCIATPADIQAFFPAAQTNLKRSDNRITVARCEAAVPGQPEITNISDVLVAPKPVGESSSTGANALERATMLSSCNISNAANAAAHATGCAE